ncbi:ATP-binding protein [Halomonas sp. M5N1S17]|uniref:ATP-binding protein n=1 Tax=Halomonas alkalisoli TaxID=2907158 RepID=UPI001F2D86C1|nr:ATP-binding protein [Halomonas alkalisoli]MCE9665282.1 ATP-binding protein [Halomonas alkalisoli]
MIHKKHLLRDLAEVDAQLLQSEKMAAIGQLAAGVAHEINNPIGYVFSNLKALAGYVDDLVKIIDATETVSSLEELKSLIETLEYSYIRDDVQALISESEEGIGRVKTIITALKDFSHIDEEDFRPSDLHRGLDSTLNLVSNELKYKAEVIKAYGDLPEIECLPSQLNQVALNLLTNAAHAIEERGVITLSTGCEAGMAWFEVHDTGRGIKAEHIDRLFEPFFSTKAVGEGTGLGLSLSSSIVQKHGGHIEVESEEGRGTRFRVWLPIIQPH